MCNKFNSEEEQFEDVFFTHTLKIMHFKELFNSFENEEGTVKGRKYPKMKSFT